jgi:hypothetical protein
MPRIIPKPKSNGSTVPPHDHQSPAGGSQLDHGTALIGLGDDDHTQYILASGVRDGSTSQAQSFGATGIKSDIIAESTLDNGIQVNGTRHYASSANDPVAPIPVDGDRYWNNVLKVEMIYDGDRSKWLSVSTDTFKFSRAGDTNSGSYYRTGEGIAMSENNGYAAFFSGTIVGFGYTRTDADDAVFEIMAGPTNIASVSSNATFGIVTDLNADFVSSDILSIRNGASGNITSDVIGWVNIKWRI